MSNCPKCRKPHTSGTDSKGWATCRECGHLWLETKRPVSPQAVAGSDDSTYVQQSESDQYFPNDDSRQNPAIRRERPLTDGQGSKPPASDTVEEVIESSSWDVSDFPGDPVSTGAVRRGDPQAGGQGPSPQGVITCPVCGAYATAYKKPNERHVQCPQCGTTFDAMTGSFEVVQSALSDANDALIGTMVGGCLVERKIGEGGMGTVYFARDRKSVV